MIGEMCTKPVVTVSPETTIQEAAHRMRTRKVGALVLVEPGGKPAGILTDRDIVTQVVAAGKDPATVQVSAVARRTPTVIREDKGILDATKILGGRGVRRLPVVDGNGKLVGIVSLDDLLILLGTELGYVAAAVESELGRPKP